MSKWTNDVRSSIKYTPHLHKYINLLWETICAEHNIRAILNIPEAGRIFKTVRSLTYLGLTESQIRDKDIINNPYSVIQVCSDLYAGKKYGDLALNIFEPGHHAELGRSRYLKAIITNSLPENARATLEEQRIPLCLGCLPGGDTVYPLALLYRYYWWTSGNPSSFENTDNAKKYVIGGLKYLVKECGLITVLGFMDKKTGSANSPMDLKKKVQY